MLCNVIPMDVCHVLLGMPWKYKRDVLHRGRTNEYELIQNGNKITLKPMFASEARSMQNQKVKKPIYTILATKKEVEHVLDQGEIV